MTLDIFRHSFYISKRSNSLEVYVKNGEEMVRIGISVCVGGIPESGSEAVEHGQHLDDLLLGVRSEFGS